MLPSVANLSLSAKTIVFPSTRTLLTSTALGCALAVPSLAHAQSLPTGGSVAAGSVAIAQPSATQMNITQSSQSAVVNWQGFSIGQGSAVNIAQPNASSAILNRVTGSMSSTIAGQVKHVVELIDAAYGGGPERQI